MLHFLQTNSGGVTAMPRRRTKSDHGHDVEFLNSRGGNIRVAENLGDYYILTEKSSNEYGGRTVWMVDPKWKNEDGDLAIAYQVTLTPSLNEFIVGSLSSTHHYQGRGLGHLMYASLIKGLGMKLSTGTGHSPGARVVWSRLAKEPGIQMFGFRGRRKKDDSNKERLHVHKTKPVLVDENGEEIYEEFTQILAVPTGTSKFV